MLAAMRWTTDSPGIWWSCNCSNFQASEREVLIVMTASLLSSKPGECTYSIPEEEILLKIRVSFWVYIAQWRTV